ncbi:hypothetical protein N657DRAFT_369213 [Parathielavia appendiculata]|uniref:Secreted protein n=1 Tax=Parathielavia appendiculata TaxID=2587402 RepID=A0AAN6TQ24_9PEZI|nr:hypothetical protein N657DRAFT_369213 [Parathielavia appendiculata]
MSCVLQARDMQGRWGTIAPLLAFCWARVGLMMASGPGPESHPRPTRLWFVPPLVTGGCPCFSSVEDCTCTCTHCVNMPLRESRKNLNRLTQYCDMIPPGPMPAVQLASLTSGSGLQNLVI